MLESKNNSPIVSKAYLESKLKKNDGLGYTTEGMKSEDILFSIYQKNHTEKHKDSVKKTDKYKMKLKGESSSGSKINNKNDSYLSF